MAEHPMVERLRRGYDAFAQGDMNTVGSLFADDIVWHVSGNSALTGDYKGKEATFGFFAKLMEMSGGNFRQEIHDILANDTHAVVLVDIKAEREGKTLDQHSAHVWHHDGERVTEFWGFPEDGAAADAFWS